MHSEEAAPDVRPHVHTGNPQAIFSKPIALVSPRVLATIPYNLCPKSSRLGFVQANCRL